MQNHRVRTPRSRPWQFPGPELLAAAAARHAEQRRRGALLRDGGVPKAAGWLENPMDDMENPMDDMENPMDDMEILWMIWHK